MVGHPASRVEDVVHQRVRLGVLALLSEGGERSFIELRDALDQSDGGLGRHLKVLADAGYITMTRSFQDGRSHTSVALTDEGRAAVTAERAALAELIASLGRLDRSVRLDISDPANAAEPRPDAPVLFASPPGHGRRNTAIPVAELLLDATYAPFHVTDECALGPDFALPDAVTPWPDHAAQRLTFLSNGLLGGYLRRWTTVTRVERISTMLLQFADDEGPERILAGLAASTVYVPGFLPVRAYRYEGPLTTCVVWIRRGPFLACLTVSGDPDDVVSRAVLLAQDQYRRLPISKRDPSDPFDKPVIPTEPTFRSSR